MCVIKNEWIDIDNNGIFETFKSIKVREGYFGVYVYQGTSLDKKYETYPAWRLFIRIPERNVIKHDGFIETRITPSYPAIETFLKDVLIHEFRVDSTRHRKSDFKIKRRWLKNLIWDKLIQEAQMEIKAFDIPKIYYQSMELSDYGKIVYGLV